MEPESAGTWFGDHSYGLLAVAPKSDDPMVRRLLRRGSSRLRGAAWRSSTITGADPAFDFATRREGGDFAKLTQYPVMKSAAYYFRPSPFRGPVRFSGIKPETAESPVYGAILRPAP